MVLNLTLRSNKIYANNAITKLTQAARVYEKISATRNKVKNKNAANLILPLNFLFIV